MSDFARNLQHLFVLSGKKTREQFAFALGLERTMLSKLMSGRRPPTPMHLWKIASFAGCTADDLLFGHAKFRSIMQDYTTRSNLMLLSFRSIKKSVAEFSEALKTYKGQYLVYYASETSPALASLLSINKVTKEGIEFTFVNPYRANDGSLSAYEYSGYMYPVSEFLYFICEQKTRDYEILSLILYKSRGPHVSLLSGLITGIGVKEDNTGWIASVPIIAYRRLKGIEDWQAALRNNELGFIAWDKLPEVVRRNLKTDRLVVDQTPHDR